ncbi:DUF4269 domain-containing protein [Leptospira idonii]|uniref:DUF4269 domain-containing protein n=1 Tax=Leptospira idonii TaxID=1193500 RepID=A0A4R9M1J5_9LEPT|nr:DUF4269 domain-containing protein [Leptospira idonii]TGN19841.1 DUF4269 domain-containing protein [Leptospira idonii]
MQLSPNLPKELEYFLTPDYLENGNGKQRSLYSDLSNHKIIPKLTGFYPLIAGTIPIGIDTEESDVDILAYYNNPNHLIKITYAKFRHYKDFATETITIDGEPSLKINFSTDQFAYEIFAQKIKPEKQKGFLHMIAEKRILDLAGENFRNQIIAKKKQKIKTEPAFGELLGWKGDPYQILADLAFSSEEELKKVLEGKPN